MIPSRFNFFLVVLMLCALPFMTAHAQDASADKSDDNKPVPSAQADDQPATYATGPVKDNGTAEALTPHQQILCPDIELTKKAAPGDISGVQADIERLNLCVERAKLLQQLDDTIILRQKNLKKLTDPDVMPTGGITGLPPLPASSLPPLPNARKSTLTIPKDLKAGETRVIGAFDKASTPSGDWQIRKIWGQGASMRAQIVTGATILNVVQGDPLPDGGTVETVSVKGVAVSRNGKINDLSWEQVSDSSPSSSSSNAKIIP